MDIRARTAVLVALGLGAVTGCGSGADLLAEPARTALHSDVQAIRGELAQDRDTEARAALAAFRDRVHALVDGGEIDPRDAVALLAQADRIAAAIPLTSPAPSAPGPSATPAPDRVERVQITVNRAGPARVEGDDDGRDRQERGKKDKGRGEDREKRDAGDDDDRGDDDDGDDD